MCYIPVRIVSCIIAIIIFYMMDKPEYSRTILANKYHSLKIWECPIDIMMKAAELASENVTIENVSHYERQPEISMLFTMGDVRVQPTVTRFDVDLAMSKAEFLSLANYWDRNGCFAIFHERTPLKLKASNLEDLPRWRALDNFGWTLELSIPGPSSSGWGWISSPSSGLIDKLEEWLKNDQ